MDWRCGPDSSQLRAQAEDRPARRGPHSEVVDRGPVSTTLDAECGAAQSATVADSSAQTRADQGAGEKWIAAFDAESWSAVEREAGEPGRPEGPAGIDSGRLGCTTKKGSA